MTTPDPLQVRLSLPCAWQPRSLDAPDLDSLWHEARLLLLLAQHGEAPGNRDPERAGHSEHAQARLEAKLDLAMHLLARSLGLEQPATPALELLLRHDGLTLPPGLATVPDQPGCCLLGQRPGPEQTLPLPLSLPARVTRLDAAGARMHWLAMPLDLEELWSQWLFRQHRRAIQARRDNP